MRGLLLALSVGVAIALVVGAFKFHDSTATPLAREDEQLSALCLAERDDDPVGKTFRIRPYGGIWVATVLGLRKSFIRAARRLNITDFRGLNLRLCGKCNYTSFDRRVLVWQTEQLSVKRTAPTALASVGRLWDYSFANVLYLRKMRIEASYVPLWNALSCQDFSWPQAMYQELQSVPKKIEVAFFCSMNARRERIAKQLKAAGVSAFFGTMLHGPKQAAYTFRSKLMLVVHTHENGILEAHRINPFLALGKCVIVERGGDVQLDLVYSEVVILTEYSQITATVSHWLSLGPKALEDCGTKSRKWMLKRVLHATAELDTELLSLMQPSDASERQDV